MSSITKKYSVIIPHKNTPELLQRCLASIPKRVDIQVIVVDDNSDLDKVDFYHFPGMDDECVEVYLTKDGKGAGYARNVGLKHAKGKWLLFADADDYYVDGTFDVLDKELNEDLDVLYFNVTSNSTRKEARASCIAGKYEDYFKTKDDTLVKFGIRSPWNKCIFSKLVFDYGLVFDEVPVGNDAMFNLKMSGYARKYKIISERLYCLTDTEGSITFRQQTYDRMFNYMKVGISINQFLYERKLYNLSTPIISPYIIRKIIHDYGLKKLCNYILYIHRKWSLIKAIRMYAGYLEAKKKI